VNAALQLESKDFGTQVAAFLSTADVVTTGVANISTQIDSVGADDARLPVTINSSERDNSWVCSPYTAYCRYAIEELQRFGHPLLTLPLSAMCRGLGAYLQASRLDQAVAVNNWLISTNLYPRSEAGHASRYIEEAVQRWPHHAIWFRSLNARYAGDWLDALRAAGCVLIPSRQVYLYDRISRDGPMPANLARDLGLLRATPLVASDAAGWSQSDFERAASLYAQLYLEKYSHLNPAYSAHFLQSWHRAGLLDLTGYRDEEGVLQAVVGLFVIDDTITAPIVGYVLDQRDRWGLYRLLMATVYETAARSGRRINLSAGAAEFKRMRGGVGSMEYSAVYVRHLPKARRAAIKVLAGLAQGIGEPIMKRFEL
jgi:hypothetical protein